VLGATVIGGIVYNPEDAPFSIARSRTYLFIAILQKNFLVSEKNLLFYREG
ncbi:unnamed protein product, partial [Musa acuminata subsp. malaccensis]